MLRPSFRSIAVVATTLLLTSSWAAATVRSNTKAERSQSPWRISSPVTAVVSLQNQRVTFYDADNASVQSPISSGQKGLDTPSGVFSVLQKDIDHHSNVYDDAAMPFMQRITWTGLALHAGVLPGHPASHGCVRMPYGFAEKIFPLTSLGMRVIISPDDASPVFITHPLLAKLAPPTPQAAILPTTLAAASSGTDSEMAQPEHSLSIARERELEALKATASAALMASKEATAAAKDAKGVRDRDLVNRANAAKLLRSTDLARRSASDQLSRTTRALADAKHLPSTASEQIERAKAVTMSQEANQTLQGARERAASASSALAVAKANFDAAAERSLHQKETKSALERQKKAFAKAQKELELAETGNREARDRVHKAEQRLFIASQPRSIQREEQAKDKALAAALAANAAYASASKGLEDADRRATASSEKFDAAETQRLSASAAAREADGRTKPVSLFVSLKTKRIYVRQGLEPIMDAPIAIENDKQPIGTHVFTAVGYMNDSDTLRWTAVSIAHNHEDRANKRRSEDGRVPPTNVAFSSAALDRLVLPPNVLARYSGYVWPGSSIIVSDEAMSTETGLATDFIVVMNDEPQGGLKSRKSELDAARRKRDRDEDDDSQERYRPEHSSFFPFW